MSNPAYVDSESITLGDGAQSSRCPFLDLTARMAVCAQPVMSLGLSASVTEAMALSDSTFCKRYRSSYKTPSSSSSPALSVRKRSDDEGHDLDDEGRGLEGEGLGLEEEATPEGRCRRHALESIEEIAPSTYEVGQSSRSMPEQQGADKVSAFRQPILTTWVDPEDDRVYTDIIIYPTRHVDTRLAGTSWDRYDDHRLIHDMLVQQAAMQRELQEMRGRVATLEQERGRREP
ncbi:hypothetical protein Tco_0483512 [Tanacetum coccineum]